MSKSTEARPSSSEIVRELMLTMSTHMGAILDPDGFNAPGSVRDRCERAARRIKNMESALRSIAFEPFTPSGAEEATSDELLARCQEIARASLSESERA